jgi:hypothetical protein
MEKERDEILFEIEDEDYAIFKIITPIVAFIIVIFMLFTGASLEDKGLYSLRSAVILTIVATISSFIFLVFFYKKRKIFFYKDRVILYTGWINKKEIKIIDIKEIYKILPYHLYTNNDSKLNKKIKRWDVSRKFVFVFIFPILVFLSIIYYVGNFIFYRSLYLKKYRLMIVGKTDEDFLIINYVNNQERIVEYFKNSINIDVIELKPNYWFFIPKKNKKG